MSSSQASRQALPDLPDLYITDELDERQDKSPDYRREMLAVHDLAAKMVDDPQEVLPRFVDLAMQIAGGVSAGVSLYESDPSPGVFRWRYLRGVLAPFDGATTPRDFSPCGVTLDRNGPVLSLHPERFYDWISNAEIVVPEVLLVPLYLRGGAPLGTLWIVSEREGHFTRSHARAMTELASFVSIALRMREAEDQLQASLTEQEMLAKEMSHRVKNLFAVTEGMIRAGVKAKPEAQPFAKALSGRLQALASAHALVNRHLREAGQHPGAGDIGALIATLVEPYQGDDASQPRIGLAGPKLICGEHAINGVAMIFHELATNAAKYGALSADGGRVDIRWAQDGETLTIGWTESGGPSVEAPPGATGFGSLLIGNTVAGQFGGSLSHDWAPEGLRVEMALPTARLS